MMPIDMFLLLPFKKYFSDEIQSVKNLLGSKGQFVVSVCKIKYLLLGLLKL